MNNNSAVIFGASGLVGTNLLEQLLISDNYENVIAVTRHPLSLSSVMDENSPLKTHDSTPVSSSQLHDKYQNIVIDFEQALFNKETSEHSQHSQNGEALYSVFSAQTHLYLCLGTTMKAAKSKAAFRRVDFEYTTQIASLAQSQRVESVALVSATGTSAAASKSDLKTSDKKSLFFYTQIKTQTEQFLINLGFKHLVIARPSLLLGDRQESRPGESLGQKILPAVCSVLIGPLQKYKPIEASLVAKSMLRALNSSKHSKSNSANNNSKNKQLKFLDYIDFISNKNQ